MRRSFSACAMISSLSSRDPVERLAPPAGRACSGPRHAAITIRANLPTSAPGVLIETANLAKSAAGAPGALSDDGRNGEPHAGTSDGKLPPPPARQPEAGRLPA